jgi:hypothetical protein
MHCIKPIYIYILLYYRYVPQYKGFSILDTKSGALRSHRFDTEFSNSRGSLNLTDLYRIIILLSNITQIGKIK